MTCCHLVTGALAIYVAFGLMPDEQELAVTGLGLVYVAIVLLTLINGTLFGILAYPRQPGRPGAARRSRCV